MLGHKTSLVKFKKTEVASSIFSNHDFIKLNIHNRRKTGKNHECMGIKITDQEIKWRIIYFFSWKTNMET